MCHQEITAVRASGVWGSEETGTLGCQLEMGRRAHEWPWALESHEDWGGVGGRGHLPLEMSP